MRSSTSGRMGVRWGAVAALLALLAVGVRAQTAGTARIEGVVVDSTGAAIPGARVVLSNVSTAGSREQMTDSSGRFAFDLLQPSDYIARAAMGGFSPRDYPVHLDVGATVELRLVLPVADAAEEISVASEPPLVEAKTSEISTIIDERAVEHLPLNGRRFTDLALLAPGVTQDPRGLTSGTNGDLAFGGVRGYHVQHLVDGADNNNAFFAQARGRYRAPYQFSNEVVQEFRVSSNTYGADLGGSGGAVLNVVTKSGTNTTHGSLFYYLRDGRVNARYAGLRHRPFDRQHQFGGSVSGRLRRNRIFYFAAFDQHVFRLPGEVRFYDGSAELEPLPADYEPHDEQLVRDAAAELSGLAGPYRANLLGNSAFLKIDASLTPRHHLALRLNLSRFFGDNNVFFDPASPITHSATSENGEETVTTASAHVALTSAFTARFTSFLRAQYSRDFQDSSPNSDAVRVRIDEVIQGFGRSAILPRSTREHRLYFAESVGFSGQRHSLRFGGDVHLTALRNFFPLLYGGQYIFDTIRVNPWTLVPNPYGVRLSPLRAYAHGIPRYYTQNFGSATTEPGSNDYALYVQDSIRITDSFALNLGVRYDLQTFQESRLESHPEWPQSGRVPSDLNNIAPRAGIAWRLGERRPTVIRAGAGIFFTRIPSIYTSAIEAENGLNRQHLFLDNSQYWERQVFPGFPAAATACTTYAETCAVPTGVEQYLTRDISAFAADFKTPSIRQASVSVERELAERFAVAVSYLWVNGRDLIRGRDVNLPEPEIRTYPIYNDEGQPLGESYEIASFATWQMTPSLTCPWPPCLNEVERPLAGIGAINVFESAARSQYHGFTVSARRRMTRGLYFRVAYTYARATDTGADSPRAGSPSLVENSYAPEREKGRSVTDQRQRLMGSWIWEPNFFHRDQPLLRSIFNDWRLSGVVTLGSGRPINARIGGDPNRDGNTENDRLPGAPRNGFNGPGYATTDIRLARTLHFSERWKLELLVEAFNVMNRANQRVITTDDGSIGDAGNFVPIPPPVMGQATVPGYFVPDPGFMVPTSTYAPRQVQFSVRLKF